MMITLKKQFLGILLLALMVGCHKKNNQEMTHDANNPSQEQHQIDTGLESDNNNSDPIGAIIADKQLTAEYQQLMTATKTIKERNDSTQVTNFIDNTKQIDTDINAIKSINVTNADLLKLQQLAIAFLEQNKQLNEALLNPQVDAIEIINKKIKSTISEFNQLDKEIVNKYHLNQ